MEKYHYSEPSNVINQIIKNNIKLHSQIKVKCKLTFCIYEINFVTKISCIM